MKVLSFAFLMLGGMAAGAAPTTPEPTNFRGLEFGMTWDSLRHDVDSVFHSPVLQWQGTEVSFDADFVGRSAMYKLKFVGERKRLSVIEIVCTKYVGGKDDGVGDALREKYGAGEMFIADRRDPTDLTEFVWEWKDVKDLLNFTISIRYLLNSNLVVLYESVKTIREVDSLEREKSVKPNEY